MARPFLGLAAGEKEEERESSRSRRASLCSKGGQGARELRWRRHGDGDRGGSVATVATGRRRRGETDQWVPPVRDLSFSILQKFQQHFVFNWGPETILKILEKFTGHLYIRWNL